MRKLLLASTALVATAGIAAAEVSLTGFAEMGIKGNSDQTNAEFHTDLGVTFTLSGETDNGISFGGSIDLEDADEGIGTDDGLDDYRVFVSAMGATLTMGDTDGAFDKAMTEVNLVGGSIADDETSHTGFSGNGGPVSLDAASAGIATDGDSDGDQDGFRPASDGDAATSMGLDGSNDEQIARFDYTFQDFTVSLSTELDDDDDGDDPVWGIGGTYTLALAGVDVGLGLAYQSQNDYGSVWGISADAALAGGFVAGINYSSYQENGDALGLPDHNHIGIGVGYVMNAFSVGVNWGQYTLTSGTYEDDTLSGYGVAVNYDLGGGLVAQLGYGHSYIAEDIADDLGVSEDPSSWSLGLAMSF